MNRRLFAFVGWILLVALLIGCAAIAEKARSKGAPGFVTGGVKRIVIEGPTKGKVGETVTFKAIGYDAKGARIKIPGRVKPTWEVDDDSLGELLGTEGETVKMECLATGLCTITAKQGDIEEATTMIEIK